MGFSVKEQISENDLAKGLRTVMLEGVALQIMLSLTSGVFLVAFALHMGASNLVIGILSAIPLLTQLIQLPSVYLVEKVGNRKKVSVTAALSGRFFLVLLAITPFLFAPHIGIWVLVGALAVKGSFSAVSNCAWNSWMRDLVPREKLGAFYSRRRTYIALTAMSVSMAASLLLSQWKAFYPRWEVQGYSTIFLVGVAVGLYAIKMVMDIPEPKMTASGGKFLYELKTPFKDVNFRRLIFFLGSWNFAANLAAPFFTVYMLKGLGYEISLVMAFSVLSHLVSAVFYHIWGDLSDRFSNKAVLSLSGPLFMACLFGWTFVTFPEKHFLTIPLLIVLHIGMGISTAGTNLATGNIAIKLAPKDQATVFLAATSIVNAISGGIAPILGGKTADFFARYKVSMTLNWESPGREVVLHVLKFQHWDFFFLFALLIGIFSMLLLVKVSEAGAGGEQVEFMEFISELKRRLRNFSSVGGIRDMAVIPFALLRRRAKKDQDSPKT